MLSFIRELSSRNGCLHRPGLTICLVGTELVIPSFIHLYKLPNQCSKLKFFGSCFFANLGIQALWSVFHQNAITLYLSVSKSADETPSIPM